MNRALAFTSALLLAGSLTGCGDDVVLIAAPNGVPVARALFDNGGATQVRVGYVTVEHEASLDGSASTDPDEDPLEFRWTFESLPEGSALTDEDITIPDEDPETEEVQESEFARFTPDVEGTYRVALVVVDDEMAESVPSLVVVQAVPPSALEVRLDWEATRADLDVHLVAPDGTYFDEDSDCFSWFPSPDWGDPALALDNPRLNADDDGEGSGPYTERITLAQPMDGTYQVYVHYYSDHHLATGGEQPVSALPTVSVSAFTGSIADDLQPPQPMLQADVWNVGILQWPEGSFSPIGQLTDHEALGGPEYNVEID